MAVVEERREAAKLSQSKKQILVGKIVKALEEGHSVSATSKKFGVSEATVLHYKKVRGL